MPRPPTRENYSPLQEVLRIKLAELNPSVDLDQLVINGRSASPRPLSWREIADQISELLNLTPKLGHSTVKTWYLDRLDELNIPREGPGPGPAPKAKEPVQESA